MQFFNPWFNGYLPLNLDFFLLNCLFLTKCQWNIQSNSINSSSFLSLIIGISTCLSNALRHKLFYLTSLYSLLFPSVILNTHFLQLAIWNTLLMCTSLNWNILNQIWTLELYLLLLCFLSILSQCVSLSHLPPNKTLDQSKFKEFADIKLIFTLIMFF